MRKALIGILLAASAGVPFAAAQAQETQSPRQQRAAQRYERLAQRNQQREQRQEVREVRQEVRQEARREVRQDRRVERQAPVVQAQPQQQPVAVAQRRGGWGGRQGQQNQNQTQPTQQGSQGRDWGNRGGDRGGNRGSDGSQGRGSWGRDRTPSTTDQVWQGDRNDPRMEEHRRRYERLERQNQRDGDLDRRGEWRDDRRDWRQDRRSDRRWDRQWRNDRRYDWQNWRYSNRNLYRNPGYYAPYRNHRYSRFSIGIVLDRLFWDQRYWIGDPWQYRLPDPGPGFAWVRYYDDVLLIDTWTGEVVDVIHDFYW